MDNKKELLEVKQNSIELKRNAKGDYAWDIKVYFNEDNKSTLETITSIDKELKEKFNKNE